MTDTLSSRLLEAIADVERLENSRYTLADSAECRKCGTDEEPETVGVATITTGEDYDGVTLSCGHEIDRSDVARVPVPRQSVLRLCRAHREIVELHCPEPEVPWSWGGQTCRECTRDGNRASTDCGYYVDYPCPTRKVLARAYGIEVDDG